MVICICKNGKSLLFLLSDGVRGAIFLRKWVVFHDNTPLPLRKDRNGEFLSIFRHPSHLPRNELEIITHGIVVLFCGVWA
jgi:hypothetical protein